MYVCRLIRPLQRCRLPAGGGSWWLRMNRGQVLSHSREARTGSVATAVFLLLRAGEERQHTRCSAGRRRRHTATSTNTHTHTIRHVHVTSQDIWANLYIYTDMDLQFAINVGWTDRKRHINKMNGDATRSLMAATGHKLKAFLWSLFRPSGQLNRSCSSFIAHSHSIRLHLSHWSPLLS